jgi:hypothetical protein
MTHVANDGFDEAVDALSAPADSVVDVADSFVRVFPVAGASISTVGDFLGNETLSASSDLAARIDELQFDLGEGPCWDALSTGRPVLEPDLWAGPPPQWPAFSRAIPGDVGAIFAFPILVGRLRIGAVDMYAGAPTELNRLQTRQATTLAGLVGRNVLRLALESAGGDVDERMLTKHSRRTIHQATGMVLAQLDISAEEAGLVIQGHAFASGRSMKEVAEDILAGRLAFMDGPSGIEEDR